MLVTVFKIFQDRLWFYQALVKRARHVPSSVLVTVVCLVCVNNVPGIVWGRKLYNNIRWGCRDVHYHHANSKSNQKVRRVQWYHRYLYCKESYSLHP